MLGGRKYRGPGVVKAEQVPLAFKNYLPSSFNRSLIIIKLLSFKLLHFSLSYNSPKIVSLRREKEACGANWPLHSPFMTNPVHFAPLSSLSTVRLTSVWVQYFFHPRKNSVHAADQLAHLEFLDLASVCRCWRDFILGLPHTRLFVPHGPRTKLWLNELVLGGV